MAVVLPQYQQVRVPEPPSTVTGELGAWLHFLADEINKLPALSVFSHPHPNSNVSAIQGALGFNLNPTVYPLWLKTSGGTNLGWATVSARTAASLDSSSLATNEVAFAFNVTSGASLAIRSGGTIWYFASSLSTKA